MLFQVDPVSGNVEAILKLYPDYMENMAYLELANESYIYYTGQTGKEILRYQISKGITSVFYRSGKMVRLWQFFSDKSNLLFYNEMQT